jgi:hypothetical protein
LADAKKSYPQAATVVLRGGMSDDLHQPVYRPWVPNGPEQRLSVCVQRFLNRTLLPPHYFTALHDADGVKRTQNARARDKVRGIKSGQLDWDIVQGQPLLVRKLELKRGKNGLSTEQVQTVAALKECGAAPIVAWTLQQAYDGLREAGFRFTENAPYVLQQVEAFLEAMDREAEMIKSGAIVRKPKASPKSTPRFTMNRKQVGRARRQGILV